MRMHLANYGGLRSKIELFPTHLPLDIFVFPNTYIYLPTTPLGQDMILGQFF